MVELQVGTYGWQHADWREKFYPDDLPEAWQLDYFSNVCRVVLVPQTEWESWSSSFIQTVTESIEDGFEIYLALNNDLKSGVENPQTVAKLSEIISLLGRSVAGFVVWSESPFTSLTLLQRPVTLISSQHCLPNWQWRNDGVWLSGSPLGWTAKLSNDGKEQAALLVDFVESLSPLDEASLKKKTIPFIIGGDKIEMEQVANVKTISELLGY